MRTVLLFLLFISACSTTQVYPFSDYNCKGFENWALSAQADGADAHTYRLYDRGPQKISDSEDPDEDTVSISLFAFLEVQEGYRKYLGENGHAIIQETHYMALKEYAEGAGACFEAEIVKTDFGITSVSTIDRSSLVIEFSNRCGDDYSEKCEIIAMTYVPPAGR